MLSRDKVIFGFGYRGQQGKDHAAATILRERSDRYKIAVVAFADPLRKEINDRVESLMREWPFDYPTHKDAMLYVCDQYGAEFDINAPYDAKNPYGKQRDLQQIYGQLQRAEDDRYWIDKLDETIDQLDVDAVIISDMRQENEFDFVKTEKNGYTVKFTKIGGKQLDEKAAAHTTENQLNDHVFDFHIIKNDGDGEGLDRDSLVVFDALMQTHKRKIFG